MQLGILAALEQRITVRRTMTGMTATRPPPTSATTCRWSAAPTPLFTDDAITLIHAYSRGKPRAVNHLALAALLATCAAGKNLVDEASARSAVTETNHNPHPTTTP